jgi:hypothetical protein
MSFGTYTLHAKIFNAGSLVGEASANVYVQVVEGECSLSVYVKNDQWANIPDVTLTVLDKNTNVPTTYTLQYGYAIISVPLYHDLGFTFEKTGYNILIENKRFTASGMSYFVTMNIAGQTPVDPDKVYVDFHVLDIADHTPIKDVKITLSSGGVLVNMTAYTNDNGFAQVAVYKGFTYVWGTSKDGYYGTTKSFNVDGNYVVTTELYKVGTYPGIPTGTPTPYPGGSTRPMTDPEREASVTQMLDMFYSLGVPFLAFCFMVAFFNLMGMLRTKKR